MPIGVKLAQTAHAAVEACGLPQGMSVVILGVADEQELVRLRDELVTLGIGVSTIVENEGLFANQATAVGCAPVTDRDAIRKAVKSLRLAR
jgi:peptidyl-tRNA hydrolase PTH2